MDEVIYYTIAVYDFSGECLRRYVETTRRDADLVVEAIKHLGEEYRCIIFETKVKS